uniref:Uncharacterized protein n=1 Tax=Leersia perrieri TaxID=77586 RepID=A0A0D9WGW9_9ORYZ
INGSASASAVPFLLRDPATPAPPSAIPRGLTRRVSICIVSSLRLRLPRAPTPQGPRWSATDDRLHPASSPPSFDPAGTSDPAAVPSAVDHVDARHEKSVSTSTLLRTEIGCVNVRLHCGGAFSPSTATRSSAFLLVHLVSGRHHTTPNLIDCKAANV